MTHTRMMVIALASVATSPLMANDLDWRISESSGNVQLLHAGLSKVATRGGLVQPGDTIVTGSGARAVVVRGEEYLMVAPSSQLRLPAAEQSGTVTKLFQDCGNVVFMIKKKMTPHFSVSTPYLAAVVKGTTFSVSVTDTGTSVQVIEGAVDVATADGGAHDLLKPGAVAMVTAGDRFRLRIEGDGAARTIVSPALPQQQRQQPAPEPIMVPTSAAAAQENTITSTIVERPVSLAESTDGLVKGTIGGEVRTQLAVASESSRAAADAIEAATASAKAAEVASNAEAARAEASTVTASATDAVKAAEKASSAADQSATAAAEAAAAKAASDSAAAEAAAKAAQAAELARAAAADAARSAEDNAADRLAKEAARVEADKEADKAAKDAEKAARDAADKAAEKAAKDAAKAADDAAREQAKQAADAAKDAEKAAKDAADAAGKAAEKAAKDAEKAAKDAVKAADNSGSGSSGSHNSGSGKNVVDALKDALKLGKLKN